MDDETDILLIDAHSKGIGGQNKLVGIIHKLVLLLFAGCGIEIAMVNQMPDSLALQQLTHTHQIFD